MKKIKKLNLIPADPVAKRCPRRFLAPSLEIIMPDLDRFHGPTLEQTGFDGSPRLLPESWLDPEHRAA